MTNPPARARRGSDHPPWFCRTESQSSSSRFLSMGRRAPHKRGWSRQFLWMRAREGASRATKNTRGKKSLRVAPPGDRVGETLQRHRPTTPPPTPLLVAPEVMLVEGRATGEGGGRDFNLGPWWHENLEVGSCVVVAMAGVTTRKQLFCGVPLLAISGAP
jgi:hypothetical protein